MFALKARLFAQMAFTASVDDLHATTTSELIDLDVAVFELQARIECVLRARGLETCGEAQRALDRKREIDTSHNGHADIEAGAPKVRSRAS